VDYRREQDVQKATANLGATFILDSSNTANVLKFLAAEGTAVQPNRYHSAAKRTMPRASGQSWRRGGHQTNLSSRGPSDKTSDWKTC